MAIDFFHRLIVSGSPTDLRAFRRAMGRTVRRPKVGRMKGWHERVPLSFPAMYALCPELTRVEPKPPWDPYDQSIWPITALEDGRAELRYQFHTRNLEMPGFLSPVSSRLPDLTLVLVTFCLDDDSIPSYWIGKGRLKKYTLPEARHDHHWALARRQFLVDGDAIYDHEEARLFVEGRLLDEALGHWDRLIAKAWKKQIGKTSARVRRRQSKQPTSGAATTPRATTHLGRDWWDRPAVRDLDFERNPTIIDLLGRSSGPTDARLPRAKGPGRRGG